MAKKEAGVNLNFIMLMTGYYENNVLVDGTLEPVTNNIIILEQDTKKGKSQTLLSSDDSGKLFHFGNKRHFNYKTIKYNHRIIIPPSDTVMATAAAVKDKNWDKEYLELVKEAGITSTKLPKITKFTKAQLRKPNPPPTKKGMPDLDKSYRIWHKKLGNIEFRAIPLRRTRALFFVFSNNEIFNTATINFCHESKKYPDEVISTKTAVSKKNNFYSSVHFDAPENLLPGIYTFKINLNANISNDEKEKWSSKFIDNKFYELKARVDFSIKTPAGDIDIIHCDPISVEETLVQQFPSEYANLLDAAKNQASDIAPKSSAEYAKSLTGLETLVNGVTLSSSKIKWAAGIVTSETHYDLYSQLGETLATAVGDIDPVLQDSVNLAMTMNGAVGKWRSLRDKLNKKIAMLLVEGKDWKDLEDIWVALNLGKFKRPKSATDLGGFVVKILGKDLDEKMGLIVKGKWAKRAEMFGKAADKLQYVDIALSGYKAITSTQDLAKNYSEQETNKKTLKETIELYGEQTKQAAKSGKPEDEYNIPARTSLQYIESSCRATVLNELEFESVLINAINSYVDTALAVCAVIPVTAPFVAAYAVVKTVIALGQAPVEIVVSAYYLLDRLANHSAAADLRDQKKKFSVHHNTSIANLFLLREDMADKTSNKYLESYRLRAHAINGMFGLMTRAAMDVLTTDGFDGYTTKQKIKKYQEICESKFNLSSYIKNYILNDSWSYNHESSVPINMDTWWTYAGNLKNPVFEVGGETPGFFGLDWKTWGLKQVSKEEMKKEFDNYGTFAGVRYSYHDVLWSGLPDLQRADFQKHFPIHFMSSGNFEEFSSQYDNIKVALDHKSIVYSAMYYREWNETKDSDWKLMKDKWDTGVVWDSISAISPLTQVRVLVVLDKELKHPYPIRLQVNRIDYKDIDGPVYSSNARTITEKDILAVDKEAQKYKKGFIGTVFYPFYQLENVTIPGIKPLANAGGMMYGFAGSADAYYRKGWLKDMQYRLVLEISKRKTTKQSVKINKFHDYFTVTLNRYKEYDFKDNKGVLIKPKPRYENALVDYDFLKSRGKNMVYSEIFKNPHVTCLVRFVTKAGTTPYIGINQAFDLEHIQLNEDRFPGIEMQMEAKSGYLKIKDFDWNSSVEFMFVVTCPELNINDDSVKLAKSKNEKLGWKTIPFKAEMGGHGTFSNDKGPIINTMLHYLGEWECNKFTQKDYSSYDVFKPLVKIFEDINYKGTDNEMNISLKYLQRYRADWATHPKVSITKGIKDKSQVKVIYDCLKWNYFMRLAEPKGHVFAAHVKLSYESLRGKTISGLRPFGTMTKKGDYFDFVFNFVSTAENAGISNADVAGSSAGILGFTDFRMKLSAPKDYTDIAEAPWVTRDPNNTASGIPKTPVTEAEVKNWIEKDSTVLIHPYPKGI